MSDQDNATIRLVFDGAEQTKPVEPLVKRLAIAAKKRATSRALSIARQARAIAAGGTLGELATMFSGVKTPTGAVMTFAALAVGTFTRLATGDPLAAPGEALNRMILGDEDDAARAKRHTREWLESNEDAMLTVGRAVERGDNVPDDIVSIGQGYFQRELTREKGLSKLREAFPIKSVLDMAVDRVKEISGDSLSSALDRFVNAMNMAPIGAYTGR